MYGADMLFVENDFGRYSIGSITDGLKTNAAGSLDILIQKNHRPQPAPAGDFSLTMRFLRTGDVRARRLACRP